MKTIDNQVISLMELGYTKEEAIELVNSDIHDVLSDSNY